MGRLSISILLASMLLGLAAPAAGQDIGTGQILFNQRCSYCHALTRATKEERDVSRLDKPEDLAPQAPGAARKTPGTESTTIAGAALRGPQLAGLLSREPGSLPDYAYLQDYDAYGDEWTPATLEDWLIVHDGNRMRPSDRADLIAYLMTLRKQ